MSFYGLAFWVCLTKTDHYTGYRECSVLMNTRSTHPKYWKATPIDTDVNAVNGKADHGRHKLNKTGTEIKKHCLANRYRTTDRTVTT